MVEVIEQDVGTLLEYSIWDAVRARRLVGAELVYRAVNLILGEFCLVRDRIRVLEAAWFGSGGRRRRVEGFGDDSSLFLIGSRNVSLAV